MKWQSRCYMLIGLAFMSLCSGAYACKSGPCTYWGGNIFLPRAEEEVTAAYDKGGEVGVTEHIINCYNDEFQRIIAKSRDPYIVERNIKKSHVLQKCYIEDTSISEIFNDLIPDNDPGVNDEVRQYFYQLDPSSMREVLFYEVLKPKNNAGKDIFPDEALHSSVAYKIVEKIIPRADY
ncbi:hypothetical protein PT277_05260 [Acetobacteraceae bacterium ESL0709]|nr:hypothetical protein [Acetobacteraceae bacterium ESL0697]MDF7678104.1 hypothetical protein [Acetobacteraceae bacterium ESL0709]